MICLDIRDMKSAIEGILARKGSNICFKVEMAVVTQQGDALTREAENFFHHAPCYGLAREDLGKTFRYGDRNYKIIGMNTRSRNNPIVVSDETGRHFKFSVEMLKKLLSAQKESSKPPAVHAALPLEGA